ncbi:hypothetical protein M406DRAFT_75472 [Cryphonectria parasitica EP155]|uniref:Uncharacterized protein n=1 Tax=Cryphonectria parasitica (strain ATCC 38755 / EP155) TaxID=660469 RepID=A0A9P4Y919_CRYP1|nr:uncharacterized protein M406DRAFT_75472 [Cryphonectria parasitica EP155]KAF3768285.1 hypothetical protein M406DRAFT_75472 [Cryphonectria parasitica EP155]
METESSNIAEREQDEATPDEATPDGAGGASQTNIPDNANVDHDTDILDDADIMHNADVMHDADADADIVHDADVMHNANVLHDAQISKVDSNTYVTALLDTNTTFPRHSVLHSSYSDPPSLPFEGHSTVSPEVFSAQFRDESYNMELASTALASANTMLRHTEEGWDFSGINLQKLLRISVSLGNIVEKHVKEGSTVAQVELTAPSMKTDGYYCLKITLANASVNQIVQQIHKLDIRDHGTS